MGLDEHLRRWTGPEEAGKDILGRGQWPAQAGMDELCQYRGQEVGLEEIAKVKYSFSVWAMQTLEEIKQCPTEYIWHNFLEDKFDSVVGHLKHCFSKTSTESKR